MDATPPSSDRRPPPDRFPCRLEQPPHLLLRRWQCRKFYRPVHWCVPPGSVHRFGLSVGTGRNADRVPSYHSLSSWRRNRALAPDEDIDELFRLGTRLI